MHPPEGSVVPPNGATLAAGTTFGGGRYVITRKLGEGGMGVVYLAEQRPINRTVVIKVIHRHLINDPEVVGRFEREVHLTARIEHPNTVRVYDCGQEQGQPYLVTEYVAGVDLATVLGQEGRLPLDRLLTIGEQVARGLRAAHAAGIVHRDLKPANVMLQNRQGERDVVTVLDFGIAKPLGENAHLKTASGLLIGTPTYMSPEQCSGTAVDTRSDLYALGLLLFEMASGRPPFTDKAPTALLMAHVSVPPPNLADLVPEVPPSLHHLIASLLEKRPEQRPSSADEVIGRLEAIRAETREPPNITLQPSLPRTSILHAATTTPAPEPAGTRTSPAGSARTQTLPAGTTPTQTPLPERKRAPASSKSVQRPWIITAALGGAALAALAMWAIRAGGAPTKAQEPKNFAAWGALSEADEPPFPEACRSDTPEVRAALHQSPSPAAQASPAWIKQLRALPESSAERWLLLARHAPTDHERVSAAGKAVETCPSSAVAHNLFGNGLQKQGTFPKAAIQYGQALTLAASYLAPSFNLAVLDIRQGNRDSALARLLEVHGRNADYPGLIPLLGKLLLAAGRPEEAVRVLEPAAAATNAGGAAAELWYLLAQALEASKQPVEARDAYCKAKAAGHAEASRGCK